MFYAGVLLLLLLRYWMNEQVVFCSHFPLSIIACPFVRARTYTSMPIHYTVISVPPPQKNRSRQGEEDATRIVFCSSTSACVASDLVRYSTATRTATMVATALRRRPSTSHVLAKSPLSSINIRHELTTKGSRKPKLHEGEIRNASSQLK